MTKKWYEEQWRLDWAASSGWLDKGLMPSKSILKPYVYLDPDFKPVYAKVRWDLISLRTGKVVDKTFTTKHMCEDGCICDSPAPGKWASGIGMYGGDDTILMYQLKALLWAWDKPTSSLFWCEGEKDARNIMQAGWGPATSHWQGGSGARYGQAIWFLGAKCQIIICMDRDKVGRQLAWHHWGLLSEVGIKMEQVVFVLPQNKLAKSDMSDHLDSGWERGELMVVKHHELAAYIDKYGELGTGSATRSWDGSHKSKDA